MTRVELYEKIFREAGMSEEALRESRHRLESLLPEFSRQEIPPEGVEAESLSIMAIWLRQNQSPEHAAKAQAGYNLLLRTN